MIFFYFHYFMLLTNEKLMKKTMEDLHKVGVHDLNNEFI